MTVDEAGDWAEMMLDAEDLIAGVIRENVGILNGELECSDQELARQITEALERRGFLRRGTL